MNVVLFRGRPGVGKTAITDRLNKELNIPVIRKDDLYDIIARFNDSHAQRNEMCYEMLYQILRTNAGMEGLLLLDFPFNREPAMMQFSLWLSEQGIGLIPVLCICSDERLWADRFNRRKLNPAPNQLITDFDELKRVFKDLSIPPHDGELVVDTVQSMEIIVQQVIAHIERVHS